YGETPNLLQNNQNNTLKDIFETIDIKSTANYYEIKMLAIKQSHKKSNLIAFKTISIDNVANCDKLKILAVKHGHGRPPKTDVVKQNSDSNTIRLYQPENYWFYTPECAQLASDTFNVLVVIFGADPTTSLFSYSLIKSLATIRSLLFCI
ncbi:22253_t:CDS:2, partial [Dentiscutata erythropus]